MADRIVSCNKILNDDDQVIQWDFSYIVENADNPPKVNNFCVAVKASELDDPTDGEEATEKANTKAAAIKSAWLSEEAKNVQTVNSVVGDVTL